MVHGSTQEARSANQLMLLWLPAGEFAYRSKEIPVIAFLLLRLLFIHSQGRFFHLWPEISQKRRVIAGGEVSV